MGLTNISFGKGDNCLRTDGLSPCATNSFTMPAENLSALCPRTVSLVLLVNLKVNGIGSNLTNSVLLIVEISKLNFEKPAALEERSRFCARLKRQKAETKQRADAAMIRCRSMNLMLYPRYGLPGLLTLQRGMVR